MYFKSLWGPNGTKILADLTPIVTPFPPVLGPRRGGDGVGVSENWKNGVGVVKKSEVGWGRGGGLRKLGKRGGSGVGVLENLGNGVGAGWGHADN